ncbi:hypothetical protein QBC47DRAFT_382022 [Echria macrotheca]|uniref:DUF7580 domain-containing protein n=1 Tax=Echria macrotheca TaxID=438768 RepID=A0AAJ0BBQ1_9PEZI|nr:hypothetical protein QBC47DRAFT_382022 [Echria macrotheca]
MSGVEFTVGVVLASVPIAFELFEQYGKLSGKISTFRHHSKEILKLQCLIGAQRTIFRNNTINLLSAITRDNDRIRSWISTTGLGDESVGSVNDSPRHWILSEVCRSRIESLRESLKSCDDVAAQIASVLNEIVSEVSAIAKAIGSTETPGGSAKRDWIRQFKGRVKLAVRKTDVSKKVDELRNYNNDFTSMTTQIVNSVAELGPGVTPWARDSGGRQSRVAKDANLVEKYCRVRCASTTVYETLALKWACPNHQGHLAMLSLVEVPGSLHSVKFEVAISVSESDKAVSEPLWIEIEHSEERKVQGVSLTQADADTLESLSNTLRKHAGPFDHVAKSLPSPTESPTARPTKRVRFNDSSSQPISIRTRTESQAIRVGDGALSQHEPTHDLLLVPDFCEHFGTLGLNVRTQDRCLGYLGGKCIQRFYAPPPDRRFSGEPRSLAAILAWVSEYSITKMLPIALTFHIAGSMAASILQFHSTPWLPQTWRTQDVMFFSAGDPSEEQIPRLSPPYFQAELTKASTIRVTANETAETAVTGARNEILFRLGIVLLELGFSRPWHIIRELGSSALPPNRQSDYHIADKLCTILTMQMGTRYPKMVRRCIGCDFGLSEPQDDLESEELQAGFLADVVLALRGLEEEVKALL